MIDIKEWTAIDPESLVCAFCADVFDFKDGFENRMAADRMVCSWRCAELITADHNEGEAERSIEQ